MNKQLRGLVLALAGSMAMAPVITHADRSNGASQDYLHAHEYADSNGNHYGQAGKEQGFNVQVGPRPYYLVEAMSEGPLKDKLKSCSEMKFEKSEFSIGHRGAPLQFPEHTKESYEAAARMGAGILECDVAFTKDKELVCRHSQCDLHTTTNILATELAEKCSVPPDYSSETPFANVQCCTSDLTVAEFKTLKGKMDAGNRNATTLEDYLNSTPAYRTDLYSADGTLMTHKESIALFKQLGVKMTPELKTPSVEMPYEGTYTQQDYAQQLINEYREAGVPARDVYPQSFYLPDVLYWIENEPAFGKQVVYLDGRDSNADFDNMDASTWSPSMDELVAEGVQIIAPPIWMLVTVEDGEIVPSAYAKAARAAGLEIISWSLERSGLLADVAENNNYYYQSFYQTLENEGDMMELVDMLAQDVGIMALFSDWPATTTYYGNCMGL